MLFSDVIGNALAKKSLENSLAQKRVSHSQLFLGPKGSGALPLAIAFARLLICQNEKNIDNCHIKISKYQHPDLHFVYPVSQTSVVKSKAVSENFINDWREFLTLNPYGDLTQWYKKIGIENKQAKIGKDEANEIIKKASLKPYEGGWKCFIIWMAEKMNSSATNKLLKIVEEPPEQTLFLFVCETTDNLLDTIISRCQITQLFCPKPKDIEKSLLKKGYSAFDSKRATSLSGGNYSIALSLAKGDHTHKDFEESFQKWVRLAFMVKSNLESLLGLIEWSNKISKQGRENQKSFLVFCTEYFRQAFLTNNNLDHLTTFEKNSSFNFSRFSRYITCNNIEEIHNELETAYSHIESNGNPSIIFSDLSIKLTKLLHKP